MFDFFLVGGDKRLSFMANLLAEKNFKVLTCGLCNLKLNNKIKQTNSIKYALKNSKNVICPIPFTRDLLYLNSENKKINIKDIERHISTNNNIFGGCIPENILKVCEEKNIFVYDYLKNKNFTLYNSIVTAESVISQAILQNPIDMHFSNCLVLGFGNCGKLICSKLKGLCSNVFVCVNDNMQKAWAKAYGYSVFNLESLIFNIEKFNYIFNTIPKKIFYGNMLDSINKNAIILDITKYGSYYNEFEKRSINFKYSPGIPGKFKAISSAKNLVDITLKVVNKI